MLAIFPRFSAKNWQFPAICSPLNVLKIDNFENKMLTYIWSSKDQKVTFEKAWFVLFGITFDFTFS